MGLDYVFTRRPPQHLECPICLSVLEEPQVSSCCGNHFCRACIQRVMGSSKPCPLCQEVGFNVMLHKGIMREVNSLEVKCPKENLGCLWKGELGKAANHMSKDCGYVEVECVYGCGGHFQRHCIRQHEESTCPARPIEMKLSSSLHKVNADNKQLKMEVSKLREKLNVVTEENKSLKSRVVSLEQKESASRKDFESLRTQMRELQASHASSTRNELQTIKQDLEKLKLQKNSGVRQIPAKPIDPQNVAMIKNLREKGVLRSDQVERVMKVIDRKHYAPAPYYVESPQAIGHNATISAPHMHAHTLELLKDVLKDGATALDVGSGSGYLTACMACMNSPSGYAIGIDIVEELTAKASESIRNDNPELSRYNVFMVTGDGQRGYPAKAPYDVIHVGGATPTVPQALYKQLKCGGRMIVPVGPQGGNQYLEQHDKKMDGTIVRKKLMGVRYGPLV